MYVINDKDYQDYIYKSAAYVTQSISITFDGVAVNTKYLRELTYKDEVLSSDTFALGSVTYGEMDLTLAKDALEEISYSEGTEVVFEQTVAYTNSDGEDISLTIPIGTYYVILDDVDTTDDYSVSFTLYDKMKQLDDSGLDFSEEVEAGGFTRLDLVNKICELYDLTLMTENFIGYDREVNTYDSSLTSKTWLAYVAERAGGFAKLIRGNNLYIKSYGEVDVDTINASWSEATSGSLRTISGVKYQTATQDISYGDDTGMVVYLSQDNYFTCEDEEVEEIYNSIVGIQFQTLNIRVWGDPAIDTGDIVNIDNYITLAQKDWTWGNGWYGYYDTTIEEASSSADITTTTASDSKKRVYTKIDELENTITMVSEQSSETASNLSSLVITTNDITTRISNTEAVQLTLGEQLENVESEISSNYDEILAKFDDYTTTGDISEIVQEVVTETTDTYTKTEIQSILNGTFEDESGEVVTSLVRTTSGTLDEDGIKLQRTDANTDIVLGYKTDSDENELEGLIIYDTGSSTELLFAGYDSSINQTIVRADNININTYVTIGSYSRIEDYEDGTGVFHL